MPSNIEREFINNLQNFTDALENLVDLLKKQNKKGGSAVNDMAAGMDGANLKSISEDIKTLVKTTGKIDSRTKEILSEVRAARKGKEGGIFEKTSDKQSKNKVVDGVKLIILISLGVLAIGMAFKLVGFVDPLSVISLSFAIVAIAMTFEKLSKIKDLTPKKATLIGGVLVILSVAIMLSSQILRWAAPISLITAFSIVAVGATVGVAAWFLLKAFEKIDLTKPGRLKTLFLLPLLLPIISLSIVLSSFILKLTQPITLKQGLTALAIGAIIGVTAYLLLKGLKGQDLSKPQTIKSILLLPLLLPAIALSIALSSYVLKLTQPISFAQGFSALVVSAIIGVAAYLFIKGIKDIDLSNPTIMKNIFLSVLLLPALSLAIALSSYALKLTEPITFTQGVSALAISAIIGAATYLLLKSLKGQDLSNPQVIKNILLSVVLLPALALAITLSSFILSVGKYDKYPSLDWIVGAGLSILTFGLFAFGISFVASNPLFYAGIAVIPLVALSIILTSAILSVGKYGSYPTKEWSIGVGLSLLAFVPAMLIAGVGIVAITMGVPAILLVALTMIKVSELLSKGTYTGGPLLSWALSLALLLPVFTASILALGTLGILGAPIIAMGLLLMIGVSKSIVEASKILSSGTYTGGPTKEWAEGVAISIGAFASALSTAMNAGKSTLQKLFGGGGISPEQFVIFIQTVSQGIVSAAGLFNGVTWGGAPTKEWADGVGTAVAAFSNALATVNETGGLFKKSMTGEQFKNFIKTVSEGIKEAATVFSGGNQSIYEGGPTEVWSQKVGGAITAFTNALSTANQSGLSGKDVTKFIKNISNSIKYLAETFSSSDFTKYPDDKWTSSLAKMTNLLVFIGKNMDETKIDSINNFADSIKNLSNSFAELNESGIYKISKLTTSLSILSIIDTTRMDSIIKSLNSNKDALSSAVNTINSANQSSSNGMFESFKNMFQSLSPKQNENSKVSTDKKGKEISGLKVDNKDITDRLDIMIKKMDTMIDLMTKGNRSASLQEQDSI